ncbi:MAG: hypothetical protein HY606_03000 [Planctomycetes bacterium]|nr:hypothetical protein [Planctomycetota bacterium]
MLSPVLEQLSTKYSGKAKIVAIDVEQAPGVTAQMGIMGTPTVILFNKGKSLDRVVGYRPVDVFETLLKKAVPV